MQKNMSGSLGGVIDDMLSGSVAGNVNFETSGGSTVTITPTLTKGTKIADFSIDETEGVLYAPTPEPPIEYEAGDNIQISEENVISATDTTYTAGDNITIENGVISATSGGLNYSLNEQKVGKWVNNKPLYEKTFNVPNVETGSVASLSDLNIDEIVYQDGFIISSRGDNITQHGGGSFVLWFRSPLNSATPNNCIMCTISNSSYNNGTMYLTIRYTKTTDN